MKYTLYLDGEFLVKDEHFLETLTPGVFEARGVFETLRVDEGRVFLLDRHLQRLRHGLRALKIRLPHTNKDLQSILGRVVMFNQFSHARARIMVYQRNHSVTLAMMVMPRNVFSDQDYFNGYHVTTTRCPIPSSTRHALVKSLEYAMYYDAYTQARAKGFNETLLVNKKGFVVEASRSNVFFLKKEVFYTPSLTLGCLDGITRRSVIECVKELKIPVKTVQPKIQALLQSDEAFLTNSLIGVMPITQIDQTKISSGRVGDWTYKIRSRYLKKLTVSAKK